MDNNMGPSDDQVIIEPEPQHDLRKFSQIISWTTDGHLVLNEDNLEKLIYSMERCRMNLPVAFVSIIGPTGSGKSFYTNLLMNYFKNDCAGSWMTKISSVDNREDNPLEFLEGFSFGNVQSSSANEEESGIYLWPEPFYMQNYGGKVVVWILHVKYCGQEGDVEETNSRNALNSLLTLLCSRITEIKWNNEQFMFLETRQQLLDERGIEVRSMLCGSIVYLFRIPENPSNKIVICDNYEALQFLSEMMSKDGLISSLKDLHCKRVAFVNESETLLHNQAGFLTLSRQTHENLDKIIKLIGDGNEIPVKFNKCGDVLRANQVVDYFKTCLDLVNNLLRTKEAKQHAEEESISNNRERPDGDWIFISNEDVYESEGMCDNHLGHLVEPEQPPEKLSTSINRGRRLSHSSMVSPSTKIKRKSGHHLILKLRMRQETESEPTSDNPAHPKSALQEDQEVNQNDTKTGSVYTSLGQRDTSNNSCSRNSSNIDDSDKLLEQSLYRTVRDFYNKEMSRFIKEKSYSPTTLSKIHFQLLRKCAKSLEEALNFDNEDHSLNPCLILRLKLIQHLSEDYAKHKAFNLVRLEELQRAVSKMIDVYKRGYSSTMQSLLELHSNGLDPKCFQEQHETMQKTSQKMLEFMIRRKIGPDEPLQAHWCTVKYHIINAWPDFERKNQSNLTMRKQMEQLSKSNQNGNAPDPDYTDNPQEPIPTILSSAAPPFINTATNSFLSFATVEMRLPASSNNAEPPSPPTSLNNNDGVSSSSSSNNAEPPSPPTSLNNNDGVSSSSSSNNTELPSSCLSNNAETRSSATNSNSTSNCSASKKQLSPLLLQLSLNQLRSGILDNNELLINDIEPTVVGYTSKFWLHGIDVSSPLPQVGKLLKSWALADLLTKESGSWKDAVDIGKGTYTLTLEFLLAFLFEAEKYRVETDLQGWLTDAVITVPYWFTSTQRIQVKNAAMIAGFEKTYLLSENKAVGLHYYRMSKRNEKKEMDEDLVVISENSNQVDISVYGYDKHGQSLGMLGHCGFSEKDASQLSSCLPSSNGYWPFLERDITKACKTALEQASQHSKNTAKQVFITFESEGWKDLLIRVGQNVAGNTYLSGFKEDEEHVVFRGAAFFGQNPFTNGDVVRDFAPRISLQKTDSLLPQLGRKLERKFYMSVPSDFRGAPLCQAGKHSNASIGHLQFNNTPPSVYIDMEINHDGIISLSKVIVKKVSGNFPRVTTDETILTSSDYTWTTPNLDSFQLVTFTALLNQMKAMGRQIDMIGKREIKQPKSLKKILPLPISTQFKDFFNNWCRTMFAIDYVPGMPYQYLIFSLCVAVMLVIFQFILSSFGK